MKKYNDRTEFEKEIITLAYEWEKRAIIELSTERNPYTDLLIDMGLWEALNIAIELYFNS